MDRKDHTSETPLSTNPALPGLLLLLVAAAIVWAVPHVLRFALSLLEELFLLLEEVVISVARGAVLVWDSWARLRVGAVAQARL